MVVLGKGFATFPVKSNWTLTGFTATLADGTKTPDHRSSLYRKGEVVHSQKMFENTDGKLGNDNITFFNYRALAKTSRRTGLWWGRFCDHWLGGRGSSSQSARDRLGA
jgi:hypothetical protein